MRAQEFIILIVEDRESTQIKRNGIDLSPLLSNDMLYINASKDGTDLGGARFRKINGVWTGDILHVYKPFRRQGIATIIYNYAEELVGNIVPSKTLKPKGKKFWSNRTK